MRANLRFGVLMFFAALGNGAGCAELTHAAYSPSTTEYSVRIDPEFDDDQVDAIASALRDWEVAVPELRLTWGLRECGDEVLPPGTICVHPGTVESLAAQGCPEDPPSIGCTSQGPWNTAFISFALPIVRSTEDLSAIARHEVGHSFGLVHDEDPAHVGKTVMKHFYRSGSRHVTCLDVEAFWRARGIVKSVCGMQ